MKWIILIRVLQVHCIFHGYCDILHGSGCWTRGGSLRLCHQNYHRQEADDESNKGQQCTLQSDRDISVKFSLPSGGRESRRKRLQPKPICSLAVLVKCMIELHKL